MDGLVGLPKQRIALDCQESVAWDTRSYGIFVRTFSLPDAIDEEKLKAEFKDGVLNLHLPKSEKAKPKAIDVKVA